MTERQGRQGRSGDFRSALCRTSSSLVLIAAMVAAASPAHAQLAARKTGASAPTAAPRNVAGQVRGQVASDALDRQIAAQTRADQIRSFATQARAAVVRSVPDGTQGLVVARGVTAAALASGALKAARDSTGRATWEGAELPVESTASGGSTLVTVKQTEERAILSWDRFDVGANTVLQFDQKLNGVAQKDWVAVNRVVDPGAAPSQILGQIKADGTVVVINRNGMIFGSGAKVSANSLLASSLDIGNFLKPVTNYADPVTGVTGAGLLATTLQDRNVSFLQNGLLQPGVSQSSYALAGMLTSSLASGFYSTQQGTLDPQFGAVEGSVTVERGASIAAGKGGYVILTGPSVLNDGMLSAEEGQVSLQAGRAVSASPSTGAAGKVNEDPTIRGLILRSPFLSAGSSAINSGLVETRRGYSSLGSTIDGSVTNSGLIAATTSVSRNGTISLTAGTVTLTGASTSAQAGGLVILPDGNGETIPQGVTGLPENFKPSQISIGAIYLDPFAGGRSPLGELGPAAISLGENSLILAPGADVKIGGAASTVFSASRYSASIAGAQAALAASKIEVGSGALIDVSGVKDVVLEAGRNSLKIDPVKRNELRDTPNYRETNTNGEFTLNGATVYVDPRITGVRDDGVAYVGSPLIEAGSAASQIPVSAAELMTRGGSVSLNVALVEGASDPATAPRITIAQDSTIDFSGGWVRYLDGVVRTSRLLTEDGRVVDIGYADSNDRFVAIGDGFTQVQTKFGVSRNYASSILQGARFEAGYDEGRDAGALQISASLLSVEGNLWGNAFAGTRQLGDARRPAGTSPLAGDSRRLQGRTGQLPSGGLLRIGNFAAGNLNPLAGDIVIGGAGSTAAPGTTAPGTIALDAGMLSQAGLSALTLGTSGSVRLESAAELTLANGGALTINAGRSIVLDGMVSAPSGAIQARTLSPVDAATGRALATIGSPFRADDDIANLYAAAPDLQPFDITVGGTLSTAGLWVNDLAGSAFAGPAFADGGSIRLEVASNAFFGVGGTVAGPLAAVDLSGNIRIASQALLDVSSGGYVGIDGALRLDATGGDIALINRTIYASLDTTDNTPDNSNVAGNPLGGRNQSVQFTPYQIGEVNVVPALVPGNQQAEVSFDVTSLKGFGFAGGGTFTLVAPDIAMGGAGASGNGPRIGLDFLQKTGFGTLNLSAYKSRLVSNLFSNGRDGLSAFLETTRFEVGAGEVFDLTQTVLPSLLDVPTLNRLTGLATGGDLLSILTPGIPADAWDRTAAHLVLGGLTELDVAAGGSITGAAGASLTIPRLYNAGSIRIAGGAINQVDPFNGLLTVRRMIGVRDVALGGGGLSDVLGGGTAGQTSGFDENALLTADVYKDRAQTQRLTNGELFSLIDANAPGRLDALLVFTGRVALNEGIHLAAGSTVDLSGVALYDPRAGFLANGQQQRSGRLVAGGTIRTSRFGQQQAASGFASVVNPGNQLVAEAGATIRLDGASGQFDERVSQGVFAPVAQWSNGGSLIVGGGAQLTGANLSARGGDDGDADPLRTKATGGVLDWVAPTLRQSNLANDLTGSTISADQVMAAGFDTLVARGGMTVAGTVDLALGKSFIATTGTSDGVATNENLVISAQDGAEAVISAPYVRFASSNRTIGGLGQANGTGNLTFEAKAIDVAGSVLFNVAAASAAQRGGVTLSSAGDVRLIGAAGLPDPVTGLFAPGLTGQLVSNGDLTFNAAQVYATTGTGNLQQLLEDRRAGRAGTPAPYLLASSNSDGRVTFSRSTTTLPETPLSAGSYLAVRGAHIEQNGVLRAPLGLLDIGSNDSTAIGGTGFVPATQTLTLGADSLTSVTARIGQSGTAAVSIPYGTTTDLIEYFFSPGTSQVVTTMPVGELRFAGKDITISSDTAGDIRVDGRGGGDVFAFEFIPGTGGSRDVLDRFNPDSFSGNNGLQFADGRQVYAILPKAAAGAALFDPVYSADYAGGGGVDLYGLDAGKSVWLDAAPGIAAGEYLLLPAHYALLPGAMRIVENVGSAVPYANGAAKLLDGSVLVGGTFGTAGTGLVDSTRRSFTVQSKDVFGKYSRIETTSGTKAAEALAVRNNVAVPRLPRDAARVVLAPLTSLRVAGAFATDAAAGGLGSQFDVGGAKIRIGAPGAVADAATADYVLLTTDTLANFNANSLSIGALRNNNANGTTTLDVVTSQILVDNNVTLTAPELLLAVGGPGSALTIADAPRGGTGAVLKATGTLDDRRTGDYIINATAPRDTGTGSIDLTGSGALIRLATGPERLVSREGDFALRNTLLPARLEIGAGASLLGAAITLDSSRGFGIDKTARIGAAITGTPFDLAVSGDNLRIGGFTFAAEVEAQFGQARHLTYRSPDIINFAAGTYRYNNLTIDAGGIGLAQPLSPNAQTSDVAIIADHLSIGNSSKDVGACKDANTRLCSAGSNLTIDAADITFRGGQFRTWGFDAGLSGQGVTLKARQGMFIAGQGGFSIANFDESIDAPLNLITPFIVDRTASDVRLGSYVRPDYTFTSIGAIHVTGTGLTASAPLDNLAPGARIAFKTGDTFRNYIGDITVTDALVRATAGTIDLNATGSILLSGNTTLATPGYTKVFDDGLEKTTVSAGGGTINLISTGFGAVIDSAASTTLVVDNGLGTAGTLNISAAQGEVNLRARLNPGVAATAARSASLRLDAGFSAFGLSDFVATYGSRFQGDIALRTATGDLALLAGQTLRADSVSLTADGGRVSIAGTIDTSGDDVHLLSVTDPRYKAARVDGGAIGLYGRDGVALGSTAALVSTTAGYAAADTRQAKGGTVSIGIGIAADPALSSSIDIAAGARIDVSALQTAPRRVAEIAIDPSTRLETTVYRLAAADLGGTVNFRAPLLTGNLINFDNDGTIVGASSRSVEAYRRFDLDAIAAADQFAGVTLRSAFPADIVILDAGASTAGKANFLADMAAGTIPDFIRNFQVSTGQGSSLDGYRVRPGVELVSANDVRFASGWNLAAGQLVNADGSAGYADALAAGLLQLSPLGAYTSGPLAGQPRYEVVYGKESELFSRFVSMSYRVGGNVRGEAPVVAVRSARGIDIANSISDGFFAFHDYTNPDFLNYQLGGGARTYNPALRISCGAGDFAACDDSILFADAPGGLVAGPPATRVTIQIGAAQQGQETSPAFIAAPYNPLANSAAPAGSGDPFGVAELFPRLTDGSAVHSSDLRFVAGAQTGSVNPLQIDLTQTGTLKVSGERSYTISATRGTASLGGHLQLMLDLPGANPEYFDLDDLLNQIDSGANSQFNPDYYTVINWGIGGTGAAAAARNAAQNYAPFQQSGHFLGSAANPTGISARLRDVVAFLRDSGFAQTFVDGVIGQQPGYSQVANLLTPIARLQNDTAYVGTVVRSGDGRIDLAAAGSIDLRRTPGVVLRRDPSVRGGEQAQVGSNAVYTAGVRVSEASLGGAVLPPVAYPDRYIQGPSSGVALPPVFAEHGGAISLTAGLDVIGRRDEWGERFGESGTAILGVDASTVLSARGYGQTTAVMGANYAAIGQNFGDQRWRYGAAGFDDVHAAIAPNFFTSGVGALSGGDVTITAGRDVTDLTVALDNSLVTSLTGGDKTLVSLGAGNLALQAGRNLNAGQIDLASGTGLIRVGADVGASGTIETGGRFRDTRNLLRLRVSDAMVDLQANGALTMGGIGALYAVQDNTGQLGATFYSPLAGVSLAANSTVAMVQNRPELYIRVPSGSPLSTILPGSLAMTSLFGDLSIGTGNTFTAPDVMSASRYGQLSLLAGGNVANISLAMSDATPANYFGAVDRRALVFPRALGSSTDEELRALHDRRITHIGDAIPARIVANGSLSQLALSLPKQARIRADGDIVNLMYQGQNLLASDVTRISAGRDIFGTVAVSSDPSVQGRSGVQGNTIVVGGPGSLFVEAGRNLGPFVTSAAGTERAEAGGIRTVGNELNPWLGAQGAHIYALFGVGKGADYAALQSVYLDPANLDKLDGDLFVQQTDALGTARPDRTRFSYAPVLAEWLQTNAPDQLAAVFGGTAPTGADLKAASFAKYTELYGAFAGLDQASRNRFLIDSLYFGELAAPSDPQGPSYNQFVRGYRAVQTLFPPSLGYTDNLAAYTADPSTVNADHPLGVPVRKLVGGVPVAAQQIQTGTVDLRLSTVETTRGGNITILGPGGDFVAGSVVRTSAQISRRVTASNVSAELPSLLEPGNRDLLDGNYLAPLTGRGLITSIPAGFEGVLTLRGGTIRSFTDGSFILNQSRLFTQAGGDITMWSSNGDLNAGQGPRSSSNFPPIVLKFDPNGFAEVDSAGSVAGAGIGAFKNQPGDPDSSIRLLAPVGTVDAGDAGVRASGSVFVAAARVANADSFSAGGTISGVPSLAAAAPAPVGNNAAAAAAANAFKAADPAGGAARGSRIFVDVLGYFGSPACPEGETAAADGQCRTP